MQDSGRIPSDFDFEIAALRDGVQRTLSTDADTIVPGYLTEVQQ
jgi:hypothetical protein